MGVLSPVLSTQEPVAGPRFNPFRGPYRGHGYFYSQPDPPTSLSLYRAHRQLLSRAFDISHLALFVSLRFAFGPLWFLGFIVFVFGFFFAFFLVAALRFGRHFGFVIYGHVKRSPAGQACATPPTPPSSAIWPAFDMRLLCAGFFYFYFYFFIHSFFLYIYFSILSSGHRINLYIAVS